MSNITGTFRKSLLTDEIIEQVKSLPQGYGYNPNIYINNVMSLEDALNHELEKYEALTETISGELFDSLNTHTRVIIKVAETTCKNDIQKYEDERQKYFKWMMMYIDGTYEIPTEQEDN